MSKARDLFRDSKREIRISFPFFLPSFSSSDKTVMRLSERQLSTRVQLDGEKSPGRNTGALVATRGWAAGRRVTLGVHTSIVIQREWPRHQTRRYRSATSNVRVYIRAGVREPCITANLQYSTKPDRMASHVYVWHVSSVDASFVLVSAARR